MMTTKDFKFKQVLLVFLKDGETMSFNNDNIVIKDSDKKIKHQSSCYRIFTIFLIGSCTITSGLLERSKRFGFSIVLMSYGIRVYGYWPASIEGNVLLHRKQYQYKSLDLAKYIVVNKISNQIYQLKTIRNKDESTKMVITKLEELHSRLYTQALDLKQILGIEGIASKIYFKEIFSCCEWKARRPRTKMDSINTLLDIGYTLLFNFMEAFLHLYGFDIYQGVYHQVFYQRKSLVCDLVEPFRPIIDYKLRIAYRRNQINQDDFMQMNNKCVLKYKTSQKYVQLLMETILQYKNAMFGFVQAYYRAFMRDKPIAEYPVASLQL